jgi:acyl-CoA thioester hydrolase
MKPSVIELDVEFEDIDAGGVVYHANYIRLCDRARSRWLANHGIYFIELKQQDIALAIRSIKADYLGFVLLEPIKVVLQILKHSEKSITILHQIFPNSSERRAPHFSAEITLVAANYSTGKSCPLPQSVGDLIASHI